MLEPSLLRGLAEMDTRPHDTLSLYLALDQSREARQLCLGQMVKRLHQQMAPGAAGNGAKALAGDLDRIVRLVEEMPTGPHRGLAVFACQAQGLFQPHTMAVATPNLLRTGFAPYLRPLYALMADHCSTLTVLLDRRKARFFFGNLGVFHEEPGSQISNEAAPAARDGDQGRAGDSGLMRKSEQALGHYLKQVSQAAMALFKDLGCAQLVVGGSKAGVEALTDQLHPYLAGNLAGVFTAETSLNLAQVAEEVGKVQLAARRERQEKLLASLGERLGPGGQAVSGLAPSLEALQKGQVHTLLMQRGLVLAGASCPSCAWLSPPQDDCPLCRTPLTPVEDIVNLALARALESGAQVEQVEGVAELERLGGLAALLRYA